MEVVAEIENLFFRYRGGFTLYIPKLIFREGFTLVSGPNGSGKTTLISLMLGLRRRFKGGIRVLGHDVRRGYGEILRRTSFLFEHIQLPSNISVEKYISFIDSEDAWIYAEELGLTDHLDKHVDRLSSGFRRRLQLLTCISKKADLYILDEPLSNLYYPGKIEVSRFINEVGREKNIIVSSHETWSLCPNDIIFLVDGRVVKEVRGFRRRIVFRLERGGEEMAVESIGEVNAALNRGYQLVDVDIEDIDTILYGREDVGCGD